MGGHILGKKGKKKNARSRRAWLEKIKIIQNIRDPGGTSSGLKLMMNKCPP